MPQRAMHSAQTVHDLLGDTAYDRIARAVFKAKSPQARHKHSAQKILPLHKQHVCALARRCQCRDYSAHAAAQHRYVAADGLRSFLLHTFPPQPFTAPCVSPDTISFPRNENTTRIGSTAIMAEAISAPQSVPKKPRK